MARVETSPGIEALVRVEPSWYRLPSGTSLAHVYYTSSGHPVAWNQCRIAGPLNGRWDHHPPAAVGDLVESSCGIYYAAVDAKTCLADMFQATRRIDRVYQAPWLVIFRTQAPLRLLDLTGGFAARLGILPAIHSGSRLRARAWARDLHDAFPDAHGILYTSVLNDGAPGLALNERAFRTSFCPPHPDLHRALADDVLLDALKHASSALGYALR